MNASFTVQETSLIGVAQVQFFQVNLAALYGSSLASKEVSISRFNVTPLIC